jgi:hypothetical protein
MSCHVVRTLTSGAGGLGSNPGGVTCAIEEDWLWKSWVCIVSQNCVIQTGILCLFAVKNVI